MPWLASRTGLDFLIYDNEHGNLSHAEVREGVLACRAVGVTPVVRTRSAERSEISPVLDAGALAVIVPMTESPDRSPPRSRPPATTRPAREGPPSASRTTSTTTPSRPQAMAAANAEVMVIPQIETARGLEAADEICSVPGVDLVWMGHMDLSQSLGIPGQIDHPRMVEAIERIAATAADHGLPSGRLVAGPDDGRRSHQQGYTALAMASDVWLMRDAMTRFAGQLKGD